VEIPKLPRGFLRKFVIESNKIDPQPGHENVPGDRHYDDHYVAAQYVVEAAENNGIAQPIHVHQLLMRNMKGFEDKAGKFRQINVAVGTRVCPPWQRVPELVTRWDCWVREHLREFQGQPRRPVEERIAAVWDYHIEYERIHPFVDGNGRSGRLLMLNHCLLLSLEPWIVEYENREAYYQRFQSMSRPQKEALAIQLLQMLNK
jgi:Fic family protein